MDLTVLLGGIAVLGIIGFAMEAFLDIELIDDEIQLPVSLGAFAGPAVSVLLRLLGGLEDDRSVILAISLGMFVALLVWFISRRASEQAVEVGNREDLLGTVFVSSKSLQAGYLARMTVGTHNITVQANEDISPGTRVMIVESLDYGYRIEEHKYKNDEE